MRIQLIKNFYNSDEYLAKLRQRIQNLKEMHENEFVRSERLFKYAVDPIAYIEDFCFIKFTEFDGNPKPFFMFDYQKEIIHKLLEFENSDNYVDALIDKPRGMGLTWLVAAYFNWRWLFTPHYSAFILSRTETEVDDGTPNPDSSIFGKLRWQLSMHPKWMLPDGFKSKQGKGTTTDSTLKLLNPAIGSSIIGSSTNANAGRSRRYSTTFVDECFYIDHFQEVYRSLTSVSRMKIFVSTTVESKAAKDFKDMCEKQGTYLPLTWKDHPFKDQQWYDELKMKSEQLDDPDLMREAQIDYSVSPKTQYYPQTAQAECLPLEYNPLRPLFVSLDIGGRQDKTVFGYWQFDGIHFDLIEAYENNNKPTDWYAPFLTPFADLKPEYEYNEFQKHLIGKIKGWNRPVAWFGELDHTVKRMPTNQSSADVLKPYGVMIRYNQYAIEHKPRHTAVTSLLPRMRFNSDSSAAIRVYDALANSKYISSDKTTTENLKPVHGTDGTADRRAMVENFAVNVGRLLKHQRSDVHDPEVRSFARGIINKLRV